MSRNILTPSKSKILDIMEKFSNCFLLPNGQFYNFQFDQISKSNYQTKYNYCLNTVTFKLPSHIEIDLKPRIDMDFKIKKIGSITWYGYQNYKNLNKMVTIYSEDFKELIEEMRTPNPEQVDVLYDQRIDRIFEKAWGNCGSIVNQIHNELNEILLELL